MITTKIIDFQHKADINIPNEPFKLLGRILVSYNRVTAKLDSQFLVDDPAD